MSKPKKVAKVAEVKPERVYNIDVLEYWKTGKKEMTGDFSLIAEGNKLFYNNGSDKLIAIIDKKKHIVINGDEEDWDDDREAIVEELQNQEKAITTSFECLDNAGIDSDNMEVLDVTKDIHEKVEKKDARFANLENTVPQGATVTQYRNYSKKTRKHTGMVYLKRVHRAGGMLVKANNKTYVCSMDDDSYYAIELKTNPKTLNAAYTSLKPLKVRKWEKENKKHCQRQGEWYFIPAPKVKIDATEEGPGFEDMALPMKSADSNAHTAEYYQQIKKKHYVSSSIAHDEHGTFYFDERTMVYEAVENLAVNSWSVQGVD